MSELGKENLNAKEEPEFSDEETLEQKKDRNVYFHNYFRLRAIIGQG